MTIETLLSTYNSLHPTNNLLCEGENCSCPNSIVRIIPIDDTLNLHLCHCCYSNELRYNEQRILEGQESTFPCLPFEVYPVFHADRYKG